jgi:hypothetical protein
MCSVIVYFLHCICVCDCDSRHESLIILSHSMMVRRSHLLARCYLGTMCMCTTNEKRFNRKNVHIKLYKIIKIYFRNEYQEMLELTRRVELFHKKRQELA